MLGLQLTPDSTSRKRTADEIADSLVTAVTTDTPLLIQPVSQSTPNGSTPAPKNPLHWKDDGKESNTVQLAEATLRHNPYQSKWGDIASHWNRVLKDLQEKGVIPLDKDYRCLQHKMKAMLDTLRAHHENLKQAGHTPRRPFSDKLYGLLCAILEACNAHVAPLPFTRVTFFFCCVGCHPNLTRPSLLTQPSEIRVQTRYLRPAPQFAHDSSSLTLRTAEVQEADLTDPERTRVTPQDAAK